MATCPFNFLWIGIQLGLGIAIMPRNDNKGGFSSEFFLNEFVEFSES